MSIGKAMKSADPGETPFDHKVLIDYLGTDELDLVVLGSRDRTYPNIT